MAEVELRAADGMPSGTNVELSDAVFARPIDEEAVYQAVLAYQINQSIGAASTLRRHEVRGGGAKPYRQKGTGRARQGSIRAPHYEGGGSVFGPKPFRARRKLTKQLKRAAICSALSDRVACGALCVIEAPEFEEPKTKRVVDLLVSLDVVGKKVLFVLDEPREAFYKSTRNLPKVVVRIAPEFSTYDVIWSDVVVLVKGAADKLAEVWA